MGIELPRPVGFVLGGGGSLGAVQVGMLRALTKHSITPDGITGTSVGALNGAMLAGFEDGLERLETAWVGIKQDDIFPDNLLEMIWRLGRSRTHAVENAPLRSMIEKTIAHERFEQLPIPLRVVTLDLLTGTEVVFKAGPLTPALLATAAIPGVFPAVNIDGQELVDGGIVSNVPVKQALAAGAASLVVLDTTVPADPDHLSKGRGARVRDVLARVTEIQFRAQLLASLPSVAAEVPVLYLPPPTPRTVSPVDFTQSDALIEDAYDVADRFLSSIVVDGAGIYGDPYTRYVVGRANRRLDAATDTET